MSWQHSLSFVNPYVFQFFIHPRSAADVLVNPKHISWQGTHTVAGKGAGASSTAPDLPLAYLTDVLTFTSLKSLGFLAEFSQRQTLPQALSALKRTAAYQVWEQLEPQYALYDQHQKSLKQKLEKGAEKKSAAKAVKGNLKAEEELTQGFLKILHGSFKQGQLELLPFAKALDLLDAFEEASEANLLFNLSIELRRDSLEVLWLFYSFLISLRSLIAFDYNTQLADPSFNAVKVDPIFDYLPQADYVSSDALLIHHLYAFKNPEFKKLFNQYTHNAHRLYQSLPPGFFAPSPVPANPKKGSKNPKKAHGNGLKALTNDKKFYEEKLFTFQTDWLLGSSAGLLFRLREELFALELGYDKIFWKELQDQEPKEQEKLEICTEFSALGIGLKRNQEIA